MCQRPFVKLYVLASGDVVLCNVDWRKTVVIGRVGADDDGQIARIWRSARYDDLRLAHLRRQFADGRLAERCARQRRAEQAFQPGRAQRPEQLPDQQGRILRFVQQRAEQFVQVERAEPFGDGGGRTLVQQEFDERGLRQTPIP